jgi:hypothetical protein
MTRPFGAWLVLAGVLITLPGCYRSLDGHTKGGMPFKKDTIQGRYERSIAKVQPAARKVLEFNGQLLSEDVVTHVLVGKVDTRNVWVKLEELEPTVTRVVVQARTKSGNSDIDLAAEIEKQIALNLQ